MNVRRILGTIGAIGSVFLAALAGATPVTAAAPASVLLAKYEPVTRFDPQESFRPTTVDSFIAGSNLEQLGTTGSWTVTGPSPTPEDLPTTGAGSVRLNQRTCSPSMSLGGLSCYAPAWKEAGAPPAVYGRVARERNRIVLQYWYFYYDDVYSYTYPPLDFIWQAHEGDWEVVNVVLSSSGQPLQSAYSEHCLGTRRSWTATPRLAGTHPIVHVAIGSHANYYSSGIHQINAKCIPAAAVAILKKYALPLPFDFSFNGGAVGGPAVARGLVIPVVQVTAQSPSWIQFPGYWGESQYFHAPPPIGSVPFGNSPVGPAFQSTWKDPLRAIASWPSG